MAWYDAYFGGTTTPAATTSSSPPGQRVWEEDRRDEPTVSVDYTGPQDSQDSGTYLAENYGQNPDPIVPLDEIPIGSTGMGVEDLKVQAQQKRAAEQKQKYISKLKNFALSAVGNDADFGYGGNERYELQRDIFENPLFMPLIDKSGNATPGYNESLYNESKFSGTIPITDYQKLEFLQNIGNLGGMYVMDDWGNPILDSSGNLIKTGLGNVMEDKWGEAFDPGGIRSGEKERDFTGSGILSFFEDEADKYWTAREEEDRGGSSAWDRYYDQEYGRTGSLSDLARNTWFSESLADVERREQARLDEGLGVATMADMEQMYDKEFAAKANPLFDPAFSFAATQEFDPGDIYGDLTLWQEAQKA